MISVDDIARAIWEADPIVERPLYLTWDKVIGKSTMWYNRTMRQAQAVKYLLDNRDLTPPQG